MVGYRSKAETSEGRVAYDSRSGVFTGSKGALLEVFQRSDEGANSL